MASHFLSVTATLESNLSNNTKLYIDVDLQHVFSMRSITCWCIYILDHELLAVVHISNSQKAVCAYSTYAGRNSSNICEEVDQVRCTCSRNRKLYFGSLLKVHQDLCAIFSTTSEGCEPLSFVLDGGRHIFRWQKIKGEKKISSVAGTRTRVSRVRAEYPNQLDYNGFVVA